MGDTQSQGAVGKLPNNSAHGHENAGLDHSLLAGELPVASPPKDESPQKQRQQQQQQRQQYPTIDRTLTTASNLAKLLPTGTVLAFQSLNPSFTNRGTCCAANRYLTLLLVASCALSGFFSSFTDSFIGPRGKLYCGIATFRGFYLFNHPRSEEDDLEQEEVMELQRDMVEMRLRAVDYVHAFFSVMVFLALALSDSNLQNCLFQNPERDTREYLVNLPLGAGFLASVVFMVIPTTRRGIGYSDMTPLKLDLVRDRTDTSAAPPATSSKPPKPVHSSPSKDPILPQV